MDWMIILRMVLLFIGVWFTIINTSRLTQGNGVSASNLFYQSVGIVGFIILQFELWK
jgi:hypothetical protein